MLNTIHECIYNKLMRLAPSLWSLECGEAMKSHRKHFMDLNLDVLSKKTDDNGIIALSHYYEQNFDMVPDPDMEIRVIRSGFAEALAYQDTYVYQRVYDEDGSQGNRI